MKGLLVDGRSVGPHGIGRFAGEVVQRLPEAEVISRGGWPNGFLDPFWLWREVKRRRPNVFMTPSFVVPIASPAPVIPTLHDLIHLQVAGASGPVKRLYYQHVLRPALQKAPLVFTVSEFSKAAILEWSDLQAERVVVVGNGVGPPFGPQGPRRDLGAPFVLMVGALKPHKNVWRALSAFAMSRASTDHLLCIRSDREPRLVQAAREQKIGDRLVFVDPLDDDRLAALYRGAACLLIPSVAEGFGLPAVEALACGTPVVGSKGTAIEEVVGDAAVLVDPLDVAEIASGIDAATLGNDPELVRKGIERASMFTWDAVGARVRVALDEVRQVRGF